MTLSSNDVLSPNGNNSTIFIGLQAEPSNEIRETHLKDMQAFQVHNKVIGIDHDQTEKFYGFINKFVANAEGTGIGLAFVKHLVKVRRGILWMELKPGWGNTLNFTMTVSRNYD
ncbi:MAG TPA: hypothetical protein DCX53_13150 [Anaerolineae bacterium]|nr:hypothetical protein [Anaerolineae bacterium]